jgi:hypothetical protein
MGKIFIISLTGKYFNETKQDFYHRQRIKNNELKIMELIHRKIEGVTTCIAGNKIVNTVALTTRFCWPKRLQ